MKVTLETLYRSYPVFENLLEQPLYVDMNLKFRNLVKQLQPHFQKIADIQNEIVREKNYPQDETGSYIVSPESHQEFLETLQLKLNDEVEISWNPIPVEDLYDAKLSLKELEAVSFLFSNLEELTAQSV